MRRTLALAISAVLGLGTAHAADGDAERIAALERRIEQLERALNAQAAKPVPDDRVDAIEQDLRVVQRKVEIREEEVAAAVRTTPVVTASEKGFALASKDGAFVFKLRGLLHADAREYLDDEAVPGSPDTFLLRRVRPTIEGTLFGLYDFRLTPDFAGGKTVLQDAYVDARFHPAAKLRVGKFKTPFGIERLQSAGDMRFVERGLPNNLVPNRDLGVQLHGDVVGGRLNYAVGVFNGVLDGGSSDATGDTDSNGDKDVAARLFAQPFVNADSVVLRGLGFGIAATHVDQRGNAAAPLLPTYKTAAQNNFFAYRGGTTPTIADGQRLRWSPQLSWYYGSFGVLGEYVRVSQDVARAAPVGFRRAQLDHDAWQLAFNWVLTGEEASYKELRPSAPFNVGGEGFGAWELVARVNELELDDDTFAGGAGSFADPATAARNARAWAVGVNWYLNRNVKFALDYEQTDFRGGAPGGGDRDDEKVLLSRLQLAF